MAGLIATVQEGVLAPREAFSVKSSLFGVQFEYALVRVPLIPHLSVVAHSTLHSKANDVVHHVSFCALYVYRLGRR